MLNIQIIPFSSTWLFIIISFFLSLVSITIIGGRISNLWKHRLLSFIGFYLLIDILVFEFYMIYYESFNLQTCLPLAFCSIMQGFAAYAAIRRNQWAFEFCMLLGILGPFQAFLSPAVVHKGEEYIIIDYFINHGLTILVPLYMTFVLNYRVRKFAFIKVLMLMQLFVAFVYFLDVHLGANYMYLLNKPNVMNPLVSGPWPYYIFKWHGLFYVVAIVVNLIYSIGDWLNDKTTGKVL